MPRARAAVASGHGARVGHGEQAAYRLAGQPSATLTPGSALYRRHALAVRIAHWLNVVALTILLMSGLGIFNAHPALYWGKSSYAGHAAGAFDRRGRNRRRARCGA